MKRAWLWVALLAALLATYSNHFNNSFHFDDAHTIIDNPYIRDLRFVPRFFVDARTLSVLPEQQGYRPLLPASFALDYWLAGGLQEWNYGRIRPFLTGVLGFTRYAAEGDNEIRLAGAAGGGVKLFPSPRIGVRLDSRFFATLVDAQGSVFACTPGVCLISLHADLAWQAEFTAGLILRFP